MEKLPEKWCIKCEHKQYYDWQNQTGTNIDDRHKKMGYYAYYDNNKYIQASNSRRLEEYTEITFEQFCRWVLKIPVANTDYEPLIFN